MAYFLHNDNFIVKDDEMLTLNSSFLNTPSLLKSNTVQQSNYQKLASGKRINSAKDDAAGMQISHRLSTQIAVKQQTLRNLQDGISYGQVADAGLEELISVLQRMRTFAIQSANGSNSAIDRSSLNEEFTQLQEHINHIVEETEVFGKKPLMSKPEIETNLDNVPVLDEILVNGVKDTLASGRVSLGLIPTGSTNVRILVDDHGMNDDINIFSATGEHLVGQDLTAQQPLIENELFTPNNGYQGNEVYDNSNLFDGGGFNFPAINNQSIKGMGFTYSGNGNNNQNNNLNEELIIDSVTEPLLLTVIGNGAFSITATWDNMGSLNKELNESSDGPMRVTATDNSVGENAFITYEDIDASAESLSIGGVAINTQQLAQSALSRIDTALLRVGQFRSEVGAKMNAIETTMRNHTNQSQMLSQANQRIKETDYAEEIAKKVSNNIIEQASMSVVMQARNITEDGILGLLSQF